MLTRSPGGAIRQANVDFNRARDMWIADRARRQHERRLLDLVDELLDDLETVNLSGHGNVPDLLVAARVWRLEHSLDAPPPAPVREASTAITLHSALLDWQDELLDQLVVDRPLRHLIEEQCEGGVCRSRTGGRRHDEE